MNALQVLLAGLALHAPASALTGTAGMLTLKPVVQVAADDVLLRDLIRDGEAASNGNIVICRAPGVGTVRNVTQAEITEVLRKHGVAYVLRGAEQVSVMRLSRKISTTDLQPLIESALRKSDSSAEISSVQLQVEIFVQDTSGIKLRKLRFDPAINKYRAWFTAADTPHSVSFEATAILEHGSAPREIETVITEKAPAIPAFSVRRGEVAAMQLTGEGFNATLPVICLEDGAGAKTVRVRERGSKRTYRAQIIGQGLLRAVGREN